MREVRVSEIVDLTAKLCMDANYILSDDIGRALQRWERDEESPIGRSVIASIIENAAIAAEERVPFCQDTGVTVVFFEMGTGVRIAADGAQELDLEGAINEGVRRGYEEGFLRKSVVRCPGERVNSGDNTPAVIHYSIVKGDRVKITVAPKGFGSENMSALKMLTPADGIAGVKKFVINTISSAGGNPCPPIIVGVGIGGTMEKCALLSKQALLRPVGSANASPFWQGIESELLEEINALGIGPMGYGGRATALAVHIEPFGTHIAGLPVAVNIGCHATRHAEGTL